MNIATASVRDLARRLLAAEAASNSATDAHVHESVRVCDKLQVSLTRLAGAEGFTALLRRALALARVEVPALQKIEVKPDCSLFEQLAADSRDGAAEAGSAIIAHLLGLLISFIGAPLTGRLVGEIWPGALINGQWRKMIMVVKMRRSAHSIDMCEYEITDKGVVIGEPLRGYRALTSGIPGPWSFESEGNDPNPRISELPEPREASKPRKLGRRSQ